MYRFCFLYFNPRLNHEFNKIKQKCLFSFNFSCIKFKDIINFVFIFLFLQLIYIYIFKSCLFQIVWLTEWKFRNYIDPALSLLMVIIILHSVWPLLQESALILLQTVPTHIQVDAIQKRLLEGVDGVLAVHEFHVWQLAGDRIIASAHIRYYFLLLIIYNHSVIFLFLRFHLNHFLSLFLQMQKFV